VGAAYFGFESCTSGRDRAEIRLVTRADPRRAMAKDQTLLQRLTVGPPLVNRADERRSAKTAAHSVRRRESRSFSGLCRSPSRRPDLARGASEFGRAVQWNNADFLAEPKAMPIELSRTDFDGRRRQVVPAKRAAPEPACARP